MHNRTTYKIRQVIDLTGVSEFLLRIWEHRYAALDPVRTKSGRRLYTESDILKARALLTLTQQGYRVGDIAQKSLAELNQMLLKSAIAPEESGAGPVVKEIMKNVSAFQWQEARALIIKDIKKGKSLNWIHNVIVPLLAEMGRQVDKGDISIAQEHILSAIIKESLAFRFKKKSLAENRPRIVFAAPEGDFHDIGIMIASHIASELKANTLFLGPHMPKNELAAVCVRYKATHLLLSSTTGQQDGAKDSYLNYLNFLDRNLNPKTTIWLAGRNAHEYSISLNRPFKIIDSFVDFESEVRKCLK